MQNAPQASDAFLASKRKETAMTRISENEMPDNEPVEKSTGAPGVPLTAEHRAYLLTSAAVTEDFLSLSHTAECLRSTVTFADVPSEFGFAVAEEAPGGILFGFRDAKGTITKWQFRPDFPLTNAEGRARKYVFAKEAKDLVTLRSAAPTTKLAGHTLHLVEGTKQALAAASALVHDQRHVVVGIAGCHNAIQEGRLSPTIAELIRDAASVVIYPDADAATNPLVYDAYDALGKVLRGRIAGRNRVKFAQLTGEDTDGLDDLLVKVPPLERFAAMERFADEAIRTVADVRPRKRRTGNGGGGDRSYEPDSTFFNQFDGGLQTAACVDEILDTCILAVEDNSDALFAYDHDRHIYKPDSQIGGKSAVVVAKLTTLLGNRYRREHAVAVTDALVARLKAQGLVIADAGATGVSATDGLVPLRNGLLDLETGDLFPHSPDNLITATLDVDFDADATCPTFDRWLTEILTLEDDSSFDQSPVVLDGMSQILDIAAGRALPRKALFLYGESRAGKGTLSNGIIGAMVPEEATTSLSLESLASSDRFAAADLHRKWLNIDGEACDGYLRKTDVFKRAFGGGDKIRGDRKYREAVSFRNTALFVLSANDLPQFSDQHGAVLARMLPVHFTRSNIGNEDETLLPRMQAEMSGILNRLVAAWRARQARGGEFAKPAPSAVARFKANTSPVHEFVTECLEVAPEDAFTTSGTGCADEWTLTKSEVNRAYVAFMRETNSAGRPLKMMNLVNQIIRGGYGIRFTTAAERRTKDVLSCRLRREESNAIAASGGEAGGGPRLVMSTGEVTAIKAKREAEAEALTATKTAPVVARTAEPWSGTGDQEAQDNFAVPAACASTGGAKVIALPTLTTDQLAELRRRAPSFGRSESFAEKADRRRAKSPALSSPATAQPATAPVATAKPATVKTAGRSTNPVFTVLGDVFWQMVAERGVVEPSVEVVREDDAFECAAARHTVNSFRAKAPAVITLTELSKTVGLSTTAARDSIVSLGGSLAAEGVHLFERRLGADDTLGCDAPYVAPFVAKEDKQRVNARVAEAKNALVTARKEHRAADGADAVALAEQRVAACERELADAKREQVEVTGVLTPPRIGYAVILTSKFNRDNMEVAS